MRLSILFLSLSALVFSCKEEIRTEAQLHKWINNPENGLLQSKTVGGIKITAKYLPAQYLAFMEIKDITKPTSKQKDSILSQYSKSLTFLLNISPANQSLDIMKAGVANMEEFKERVAEMNFGISEYISLKTEKDEFSPTLLNLENVYGLKDDRNIYLVFANQTKGQNIFSSSNYDLTFQDNIFNSGISHFIFKKKDIDKLSIKLF